MSNYTTYQTNQNKPTQSDDVYNVNRYTWWQSDRSLNTYEEMLASFNRAKSPDKGKPVNRMWRMFKNADTIRIVCEAYGTEKLAEVTPDNIITFIAEESHIINVSHSYVSSFYRWFPFVVNRHRKGLYRIRSTKNLDNEINKALSVPQNGSSSTNSLQYSTFNSVMNSGPAYFKGIQFNLLTGECLNQRPDDKFIEIPAKRKEWRQILTAYKKGLKARAKVHALDAIALEAIKERDNQRNNNNWYSRQPDWSSEEWLDCLEKSMTTLEFPKHLLKGFIETSMASNGWGRQSDVPTVNELYKTIDKIFVDLSIPLRRRFKVFLSEGYDERIEEKHSYGYKLDTRFEVS